MRIMVKGGVWKNTEDEILKAAVMKYGKNQWARISSLLVRKSAKQCKSRWFEWLDPAIKKTEWSREEEEKLLHLAKIMPNQWKTIAPKVGRTASQCLEHYEKLLDAAQEKDEEYDAAEDPRRLRPGEIDPNPEAKPARPDPVDMDEDEKEMLSEARARLANTKGKKAKRKAREKQLEEARRLATLQKRRELKAAGIDIPRPKRKIKGIDYNKEIPFHKKPAPGFHAVDWEAATPKSEFKPVSLDVLEGKRRREEEEENRKRDTKKQKTKEKKDLPAAIMQINKLNDPESVAQRSKLMLPPPQLDEVDLEELRTRDYSEEIDEQGNQATRSLLPSYNATPTPARPLRTPMSSRTPSREDTLKKEAQNLIALTAASTPLAGGANPSLHPSDFSGATPKQQDIRTPNTLATPSRTRDGQTPVGTPRGQLQLTPQSTPVRDGLSINDEKEANFQSRYQVTTQRNTLQDALRSLPAPQNEYKIMLPELPEEEKEVEEDLEHDSTDLLRKQQRLEEEKELKRLRQRSQVLQRNLPRPLRIDPALQQVESNHADLYMNQAEKLLNEEMLLLISHEAVAYPLKESRIKAGPSHLEEFDESQFEAARNVLALEMKELQSALGELSMDQFEQIMKETDEQFVYSPTAKTYTNASAVDQKERIESLSKEFDNLKAQMGKEAARAAKLEQKLNVYNGGYYNRANTLVSQIEDLHTQIDQGTTELECFLKLWDMEKMSIPQRTEILRKEVQEQEQREAELQKRYLNLQTQTSAQAVKA